jgi:hypothetical protein
MSKINLKNKKIRLFFHTDLDGVISANLIQLFSDAEIIEYVPCPYQNYPKPPKINDVLDVFVDCRSRNRDEDVRIDHHASGEDSEYLKKDGILLDTSYKSAVSLVAHYLGINVNKQILEELDKSDSGEKNVFTKFVMNNQTLSKIIFQHAIKKEDYGHFEMFKDKLLSIMEKGFSIEDLNDTPKGYEQKIEKKFKVVFEDIKKSNHNLIKLIHSPVSEGIFLEHIFKMNDSEFFSDILPYFQQHYYKESEEGILGVYVVVGFLARNYEYDEKCNKVIKENHVEPYQIFVSRSAKNTTINIGELIIKAKELTGITNGGGREGVGGINTSDKEKAIKALKFITEYIREHCP